MGHHHRCGRCNLQGSTALPLCTLQQACPLKPFPGYGVVRVYYATCPSRNLFTPPLFPSFSPACQSSLSITFFLLPILRGKALLRLLFFLSPLPFFPSEIPKPAQPHSLTRCLTRAGYPTGLAADTPLKPVQTPIVDQHLSLIPFPEETFPRIRWLSFSSLILAGQTQSTLGSHSLRNDQTNLHSILCAASRCPPGFTRLGYHNHHQKSILRLYSSTTFDSRRPSSYLLFTSKDTHFKRGKHTPPVTTSSSGKCLADRQLRPRPKGLTSPCGMPWTATTTVSPRPVRLHPPAADVLGAKKR